MLKDRKPAWLAIGIVVLILLLNIIIIKAAFADNQDLFWMLIVSIPLLIIAVYNVWQTDLLFQKHFTDRQLPSTTQSQLEWLAHSLYPNKIGPSELNVQIGNDQCSQPYNACIFNIRAMEDTDMESTFIGVTKENEFEYSGNSVSERLNTYDLAAGGLAWQIGSGYQGCRTENGHFNSKAFKINAHKPEVKMIELKLSTAIKPIYPIDSFLGSAEPSGRKTDNSIFSDSAYTTFRDAEGMIHFLNHLRELSGGKPIGIRLCINDKKEFYQICHAVRKTQLIPDFIAVEGSWESTGIIHSDQTLHTGIPLCEALLFVSQTLQTYGLQNKIRVIADGKIFSCFDILKVLALGANVIYTEMPCYTAVKNRGDSRKLSFHYNSQTVSDFHVCLLKDTVQIMRICGFKSVSDVTLSKFLSRLDVLHSKYFDELNGPVSYPGSVKKIYNSKMKSHQLQNDRKKVSIS